MHNIRRVDEEFLHVFYDILCRFYRPKMAYKTTNLRYFDEAYQDSAPWENYQPYHMSL